MIHFWSINFLSLDMLKKGSLVITKLVYKSAELVSYRCSVLDKLGICPKDLKSLYYGDFSIK